MPNNHGSTSDESSANRRSVLRKMAAGAAGLAGVSAASGSTTAHSGDCETEVYCRRGDQWVKVTCPDGHVPVHRDIGTSC